MILPKVASARRRFPARRFGSRSGQAVILVVVAMSIFLVGALGLAIDGSQMYAQWQMAQAAADAAAQAGAMSIFNGTNVTAAYPFGMGTPPFSDPKCTTSDLRTPCVYARDNGFGATAADTVTLSYPASVPGVALSPATVPAITVTVQRNLRNGLIRLVGGSATSAIHAKATAAMVGGVSTNCVYALDPSGQDAFLADNGSMITIDGCGIAVDSTNTNEALNISGGAHVSASAIAVMGAVAINNGGVSTPPPVALQTAVPDPFRSLPEPVPGTPCLAGNYSNWGASGTYTLNPGTYCGGISVSNGITVTLNPGIYIISGGSLSFQGNGVTGSGVMFYLTGASGGVTIANGENVNLSAETSGTYQGVLFFQDKLDTNAASFAGGAAMQLTGSLYFPGARLSYSNGTSSGGYVAIIAKQVYFAGGTSLQFDATGLKTGLLSKSVALVQ